MEELSPIMPTSTIQLLTDKRKQTTQKKKPVKRPDAERLQTNAEESGLTIPHINEIV